MANKLKTRIFLWPGICIPQAVFSVYHLLQEQAGIIFQLFLFVLCNRSPSGAGRCDQEMPNIPAGLSLRRERKLE
jgi:hypothetical protein